MIAIITLKVVYSLIHKIIVLYVKYVLNLMFVFCQYHLL